MNKFDTLNDKQKEAMFCTDGPELILAGAGSGKTKVLTHRTAYLIEEKHVNPWNIMAITFTNKAAAEMRSRVDALVGNGSEEIWVATFHSTCVRILRRFIDRIGYDNHFTIYDADDQKTVMKKIFREKNLDTRVFKERNVLAAISSAKDELIGPEEYKQQASGYGEERTAECYAVYQAELKKNNALDFDDLIVLTVRLFRTCPDVISYYQERFRYIMVDEYQDTNTAQFKLVELLAGKYKNICVVGDDDQSIYKFRGANIGNILHFEDSYPGAKVVKLEQNYRSTANILNAANEVIRNNRGRKDKHLWTSKGDGGKVKIYRYPSAVEEAKGVISEIKNAASGGDYSNFAVLYRTNAQSRLLEEKCVSFGVPYQLVGGVNFYQRKEIKDILAYLKTIANGRDDLAAMRIINVPKRGIGAAGIGRITVYAEANGLSFYDACASAVKMKVLGKSTDKVAKFTEFIENLRKKAKDMPVTDLIDEIMDKTGYREELLEEGEVEAQTRTENIEELKSKAASFENETAEDSGRDEDENGIPAGNADLTVLDRFLEEVALVSDVDRMEDGSGRVTLMTLHAAKGLEFPDVYITGMEDGLFPGNMSIAAADEGELEEERRLCYVGITRAKERLTLTWARQRMVNGETRFSDISRFLKEIPGEYTEEKDFTGDDEAYSSYGRNAEYRRKKEPDAEREYGSALPWENVPASSAPKKEKAKPPKPILFGKEFKVTKADHLEYGKGDRVRHFKFGEGTVLSIVNGSRDFEVTVDFDSHGVKKMFAGFARLEKV